MQVLIYFTLDFFSLFSSVKGKKTTDPVLVRCWIEDSMGVGGSQDFRVFHFSRKDRAFTWNRQLLFLKLANLVVLLDCGCHLSVRPSSLPPPPGERGKVKKGYTTVGAPRTILDKS